MPITLIRVLHKYLPRLFPSDGSSSKDAGGSGGGLGVAIAQGVELPMEAEMAWLAATMSGADGWLRIGIRLKGEV